VTLAIRNAALLDKCGYSESAAAIAGFASSPFAAAAFPEINAAIAHLRDQLGNQAYESLARVGAAMTTAAMAAYAYDQIDRARTSFTISKWTTHLFKRFTARRDDGTA
jgi:hypothetical protein